MSREKEAERLAKAGTDKQIRIFIHRRYQRGIALIDYYEGSANRLEAAQA
jgi:hypothetical protein